MTDDRRATRWRSPDEPCLNCGDSTPGRYCPTCGQRKTEVLVSVRTMLADVLEDQLVLNRALPRTVRALLLQPGLLTEEYVRGRIVRYIAPFRLYLVSSVIFFLIMSFIGVGGVEVDVDRDEPLADAPTAPAVADSAAGDTIATAERELDTGAALTPGTMQRWARELTAQPEMRRLFGRKVAQVGHLPLRDAIREVLRDLLEYAPHMVFLLLPMYALLLKLLYVRRSRYYAEHFVFALHVHSFVFLVFTIMILVPDWADPILLLWMMVYVWLAMKRVYRQGWFRTTAKWWVLFLSYSFLMMLGLIGLALVTLLFT